MAPPTCFHLHFNTPDVQGAAGRLVDAGVALQRRFGSVRGEGVSLRPGEEAPDQFRFKLQVHRRGRVDVTLAPGQRPRFDHLGLVVDEFEAVLGRAESRGWPVRRDERRTFVMTPWGFRAEVHPADGALTAKLGDGSEARIDTVVLWLPDADAARSGFDDVFGGPPELRIEPGEGPWLESFDVVAAQTRRTVDVRELLEGRDAPA